MQDNNYDIVEELVVVGLSVLLSVEPVGYLRAVPNDPVFPVTDDVDDNVPASRLPGTSR